MNPPWRVVERVSADGAWTLHLEHGGDAPVSLVLFGAHHEVEPARPELDILANKNTFLAIRKHKLCDPRGYRPRPQIRNVFAPHGSIKTDHVGRDQRNAYTIGILPTQ